MCEGNTVFARLCVQHSTCSAPLLVAELRVDLELRVLAALNLVRGVPNAL